METKRVLGIIFGSIAVLIFGFVLTWGIINFNKVKDGMSGTGLYTKEDLNNSYEDGYNTALMDKAEYEALISGYRDTITTQTDQISKLNSQITTLNNNNKDYKNQIQSLNDTITTNEETISNLQSLIDTNDTTIAELETEIANYENQITVLEKEITALQTENSNKTAEIQNKQNQVASLNNQVNSLQNLVNQLNTTNETNLATINTLNNQIQSLNNQISDLKLQINNNDTNVADLNNKIADLEKSVAYYEQYISNLETETQVVATFEFDGAVYNVQILNKGAYASVVAPTSTDYVVFNGWAVNNEIVDLNTYAINENTKFVADVTYNHDVKFSVDNIITESQIVAKDNFAVAPTTPIKDGYSFDGWTVDGVNFVDVSTYAITDNTTFTAVFTKMHTVTFVYEDETISTQSIKNGYYAENVTVENTTYKVFNGWLVNGTTVDIATYKISADTVFVADVIYKYDVTFTVDGEIYDKQIVTANNYALNPTVPTKDGYIFKGWSIDGINVVDVSANLISSNITYIAIFESSTITYTGSDFTTSYGYNYNRSGYNIRIGSETYGTQANKDLYAFLKGTLKCTDARLVLNIAIDDEISTNNNSANFDTTDTNFVRVILDKDTFYGAIANGYGPYFYADLETPYTLANGVVVTQLKMEFWYYSWAYMNFEAVECGTNESGRKIYYPINNMEIVEFTYTKVV